MIDVDMRTETRTTRRHMVHLHGEDIVDLLIQELKAQGVKRLPTGKVEVVFAVPSGGDYSGMEVDISDAHPVIIRWEESSVD